MSIHFQDIIGVCLVQGAPEQDTGTEKSYKSPEDSLQSDIKAALSDLSDEDQNWLESAFGLEEKLSDGAQTGALTEIFEDARTARALRELRARSLEKSH